MTMDLLPHGPPLLKCNFTSTYDATLTKHWIPRAANAQPQRTGHCINTPSQCFRPSSGMRSAVQTTRAAQESAIARQAATQGDFAGLAARAASPKAMATAHVRNQPHIGADHADGKTPLSCMKQSYTLKCGSGSDVSVPSHFSYSQSRTHRLYPGSGAVQYNPRFLAIDSPDDTTVGKAKRTAFSATGGSFSPVKCRRPREDAHLNISLAKSNPYLEPPLHPHAEQKLKVASPVEYHVYRNQRPYVTQARVYGDTKSVTHESLATTTIPDATKAGSVALVGNKRSLLDLLGGYTNKKERPSSGPARMGGLVHAGRAVNAPATSDTEYRVEYFNRRRLPEQPDPHHRGSRLDKALFVSLNKHPIDFSAHDALNHIRTSDGSLRDEKPDGVHPSIWTRICRAESRALSESQDPHRHKRRHGRTAKP